jgi:CHAT domain-containing protein
LEFHFWSTGKATQSAVALEKPAIASSVSTGSGESYANAVQQGIERYQAGKFTEAIALWEQALPQISGAQDRAIVYSNLAIAYQQIGQLDRAIAHWEQAIQIYRSQDDEAARQALAKLLTEQGQAYSDLGQHKRAITLLQSAIAMAQNYQDKLTEAAAQGALGTAYWALGDYEQASASYQTSLNIARELNNSSYIATALNNFGNTYISRAERYTYQATSAQLEGDDREYNRLTQAATQARTDAKTYFEQSLQAAQGASGLEEVRALMNLNRLLVWSQGSGISGNSQGQLTDSDRDLILRNFNRARELLQKVPDSRDKAYALINLAESVRGQQSGVRSQESKVWSLDSKQLLEEALAVARKIGDARAESFALGSLGELYEAKGDLAAALELNRTAQFAAQQINAPDSLYLWQWHVGRMLNALGEKEKAIAAYEQAIASLQSIRGDIVSANKDFQLDFREQVEPVYRELIALLLESPIQKSNGHKSINSQKPEFVNSNLAPLSVDSESHRGINSTADSSSPLKWAKTFIGSGDSPLERTIAVSQGIDDTVGQLTRGLTPPQTPPRFGEGLPDSPFPRREGGRGVRFSEFANNIIDSLADEYSDARSQFNPKSNREASPIQKVVDTLELLKLAELQNFFGDECVQVARSQGVGNAGLTDANTAVVYSVILDNQTAMILRSPNGTMTYYRVAIGKQEIEKEIDQLRYFLELRQTEEYLSQAQKIYNLLIRPMEADLAAIKPSTVVFINDGVLRKVPMAALHDGQEFFIQKYPIATTPSLSLTAGKPLNHSNMEALSVGLTVERSPFAPLTYVQAEVNAVKEILGGTELIDNAFTLPNLQAQLQKKSYPIVHLATHGKFGVDAESTFLVGFDQRISIEKLDNLLRSRGTRQPVELLTLSACQTAAGDNRSALGIAGVAVRAGVESALATLWYINDEATVPLIKEFYSQLRQPNITKAEALRRTQIKMITDANYNHPAVWSPFILIGNWL